MKLLINFFLIVLLKAGSFSYCKMCHNGKKEINLNDLTKKEIKSKLMYFKKQKNGLMPSIAKKLTKKDIENILKIYGK
jgi:cytochrome c553